MDTASSKAESLFQEGFNCGQSVFGAFADTFGIPQETALKINSHTVCGIGYKGHLCGAVNGAYQAISMRFGRATGEDDLSKELVYSAMKQFDKAFTAKHRSLMCSDLIGSDVSTEAGLDEAIQNGKFKSVCPNAVKDAAKIASIIISAGQAQH